MTPEEALYISIGQGLEGSEQSQMFGKPCFKVGGKAFISFFQNEMVFKLTGDAHKEALSLDGSQLFDPSGKGRAMKEWIQIPLSHENQWPHYAKAAFDYVSSGK